MNYSDLSIGQEISIIKKIGKEDVDGFMALSGDNNSVHVGGGIVHGMLLSSFISAIIGKHLPGDGSVWKSFNIKFINPVFIGDILTFKAKILKKNDNYCDVAMAVDIYNSGQSVVAYSVSVIKVPE